VKTLSASQVLIVDGIENDPLTKARADRMLPHIPAPEVRHVNDAELNAVMEEVGARRRKHGMNADIKPVVIFNRFRFDDTEDEQARRIEAFQHMRGSKLNGYGGFDWRESGTPEYRKRTGLVCQPAWHIHTVVGCHFRCAYCNLGWFVNIMLNLEEYVGHLDEHLDRCPEQKLFQWDNVTDVACWEPEYGCTKLLVDYFAGRPGQALLLYIGKSDNVDYLLDYDHRGHTVPCWSLAGQTQSVEFEKGSAPMAERIASMRKCQKAGYPVRVRLSPIIPVKNWREENREMLECLFNNVTPDVVTMETIRFMDLDAVRTSFDESLLDPEFLDAMKATEGQDYLQGCELPHAYRQTVYEFIMGEMDRLSPDTPYALCRESLDMWNCVKDRMARHGQTQRKYFCNCGAHCAPNTAA